MRLLVAVSNEPLAHAIHGALLAGRHEVSLASTGSIALAAVAKEPRCLNESATPVRLEIA